MAAIKKRTYRGPKRFVEYREAQGETVEHLRYWHSPAGAQAIIVKFTDGTRVHIGIEPVLKVEAEVETLNEGDVLITKTYRSLTGSPVA